MNSFLFVSVLALSWFFPESLQRDLGLSAVYQSPFFVAFQVIRLGYHIPLLGILNFYVIMMLAAAPFIFALRNSTLLSLVVITAIYAISQIDPLITLSGGRFEGENGLFSFNPLAWQTLFLGGIIAGRFRVHEVIRDRIARTRRGFLLATAVFFALTLIHYIDGMLPGINAPFTDKQTLGPVRLLHSLIVFIWLFSVIYRLGRFSTTWPYRSLSLIGSQSLQCFMATVVFSYGMAAIWFEFGSTIAYFCIAIAGCLSLLFFAIILRYYNNIKRNAR